MRGGRGVAATALAVVLLAAVAGAAYHHFRPGGEPSAGAAQPVPMDNVAEMLGDGPPLDTAAWRFARLRSNPRILVIEFPGLRAQAGTFNRVAALTEKTGAPRDRLLSDDELAALIRGSGESADTFYFGHDYSDTSLLHFYNLAAASPTLLNPSERQLREALLARQVLAAEGARLVASAPPQAVISFTRTQADDPATPTDETVDAVRREAVLRHELSHGQFFTRDDYRAHCWEFWRGALSEVERQSFRKYLAGLDYDPQNEELMVNETQALLMHTPDPRAFDPADVGLSPERLRSLQIRFGVGVPAGVLPDPVTATP